MLAYGIVSLFVLTALYVAVPASASGSVDGAFPDRTITLSRTSQRDSSYTVDVTAPGAGSWWVSLESIDGSWVLVQVYDSDTAKGKPVASTDLKAPGDASKPVWIPTGATYLMRLTYFGKAGSAVLAEQFVEKAMPELTKHEPIQIWGNEDFTVENGVTAGSGVESDPYVISGWMIKGWPWNWGIMIGRTTKWFVVSDCMVYRAAESTGGVGVHDGRNGVIQNVVAYDCPIGIWVSSSEDITVRGCTVYSNDFYGIAVNEASHVVVESNTIHDESVGVFAEGWWSGGIDVSINSNTISDSNTGIYLDRMKASTIDGNTITDCDAALFAYLCSGCVISNNVVSSCVGSMGAVYLLSATNCALEGNLVELSQYIGISVLDSNEITLNGNTVSQNGAGIVINPYLYESGGADMTVTENIIKNNAFGLLFNDVSSAVVYRNDFFNNLAYETSSFVAWDYMGTGNYWSDYAGVDLNNDGIGDSPYSVEGGGVDNFPLMAPCVAL